MYLCYFDESGDAGVGAKSPTKWFVLACTIVHESHWLETLDSLITLRRGLKATYGIPTTPEIKAQHLARGNGPLRNVLKARRWDVYRDVIAAQATMNIHNFAVAIDKQKAALKGYDPREDAWTFSLERINTFVSKASKGENVVVHPDGGHDEFITKRLRAIRRHHNVTGAYGGRLKAAVNRIVEDPSGRDSRQSYFVQVADWNAYAAHRSLYLDPLPSVPATLWDALAPTHLTAVNNIRGGPSGMVIMPK